MRNITITVALPDEEPLCCEIPLADYVEVNASVLRTALDLAAYAIPELYES